MDNKIAPRSFFDGPKPRVIAHRGSSGTAPENTMEAFRQALAHGADILEMDVHLTADGVPVVIHDETVERTTDGSGLVRHMTFEQLKHLDAGYRFTADGGITFPYRGTGITIPSFEEVLQCFQGVPINFEVKADDDRLLDSLVALLTRYGRLRYGDVFVAGFKNRFLRKLRRRLPLAFVGNSRLEIANLVLAAKLRCKFLFFGRGDAFQPKPRAGRLDIVTPATVNMAHRLGLEVHVWTIDEESEMTRLLDMGVDGLFTNFPERMRRLIDSRGKQQR